ncbi:HD domain-containing protein [Pelosinus sp. UFO1]|uniref:HD domain-containing protein n=1 Tax=Pelosinus sp. UFO1 TaxID=484770 RepID=UPI0004D0FCA2|nr:HD domain-containing protein [Pelosinus sp. UFO1]AIF50460.1 metal-dependent phosphohydrolase HD sub domain-containing protein [Pelosinus sp. UFO1]
MNRVFQIQERYLAEIARFENTSMIRDISLNWEKIHMASCAAVGRILALKRGVDAELSAIACSIHDYGRIITGKQYDHAAVGYDPLKLFLAQSGYFTSEEIELLAKAAQNHSNKKEIGSPLEEIVKDADVFDCYQYGLPLEREEQRVRLKSILEELSH